MRYLFMRSQGRINSMEAPVVPKRFARTAPMNRKTTFAIGVASPFTLIWMPPETTNSEPIKTMKLAYSVAVDQTRSWAFRPAR